MARKRVAIRDRYDRSQKKAIAGAMKHPFTGTSRRSGLHYTSTMPLECWYYIAGIASALIGFFALIGLAIYAYERANFASRRKIRSRRR